MQATGMLRGTGAMRGVHVLVIGTLILAYIGDNAHAFPLQLLPNIPGYIPVYIRHGDQPLDEINPALAEAFHEKQILESTPPEGTDHSSDDLGENFENHPSYDEEEEEDDDDDNGGLSEGTRRKGTIFLIGVRQPNDDRTKNDAEEAPKIALPFEVLEREAIEANSADNQDRERSKDVWTEELGKQSNVRNPIGLSKEAAIKLSGLPVDVKDLEKLAAEVEKEETLPNNLYDTSIANDPHVSWLHRRISEPSTDEETKERKDTERIIDVAKIAEDRRILPPIEDPKEFISSRSRTSERMLKPARDPEESRLDDKLIDFMIQEE